MALCLTSSTLLVSLGPPQVKPPKSPYLLAAAGQCNLVTTHVTILLHIGISPQTCILS